MRNWTILLFAAAVTASPGAWAQKAPATTAPVPHAGAPDPYLAPTGEVKPPGAAVPEGDSRMDQLERKSDRIGREMERSVCKC